MTTTFTVKLALHASSYDRTAGFILCVFVGPCGLPSVKISLHTRRDGVAVQTTGKRGVIVITLFRFTVIKSGRAVYALTWILVE